MNKNPTILYFGFYDSAYARNAVLVKGLRANGVKVAECNVKSRSFLNWARLALKCLGKAGKYDAMIVGFPGQEAMFLARLLTRKPIIFNALTSHYQGYILDRKHFSKRSFRAYYFRFLDKWSCRLADLVLLDTESNIDFFVKEFNLSRNKFLRVFLGTDDQVFYPKKIAEKDPNKFLVHFHGHFIPLQGAEYIIKAANILREDSNVMFQIIGRGQEYPRVRGIADELGLKNILWIEKVSYENLADYVNKADICLGGFGDTEKAKLVSMNKLFEYMACGKPIITGDSPGMREFLEEGKTAIFCRRADPDDLAGKILVLKNNEPLRAELSLNARKAFETNYTPRIIVGELSKFLEKYA